MAYDPQDEDSEASSGDHDGSESRGGWDRSSPPSDAIVEAIAEAIERDPTALSPLHRFVDPDALDTLLTRGMQREEHVHVSFTFDGLRVGVGSDGTLSVRAADTTHESTTAPETRADLEAALEESLRLAFRNGSPVTGGYEIRNGPEVPDWDIVITEVEKPRDDDA